MSTSSVTFCGTPLSADELALIGQCAARFPRLSRAELAATLCQWLGWQRPNGRLKTRECRDLLEQLAARELVELPVLRAGRPREAATRVPHTAQGDASTPVSGPLRSLQPIRLHRVEQPAERALWRELMDRHHYLGHRTAYGASLRYLIETDAGAQQTLGALQFSSPAWRMRARDAWIGWSEPARKRHLPRLINNSRFLILPSVRVPHLASHVLGLALRRVLVDWQACGHGWPRPWSTLNASPGPATAPPNGSTSASPPDAAVRTVTIVATTPPSSGSSSIHCAPTPDRPWLQSHNENCCG
jgi:hypothetical protein